MRRAALVLALLLVASIASAQDTGGSFGGGDWGSGGGGDFGGGGSYDYGGSDDFGGGDSYDTSSDWGSDNSYDWGSDDDDYSSGGSGGSGSGSGALCIVALVFLGFCAFFFFAVLKDHHGAHRRAVALNQRLSRRPPSAGRIWNGIDVAVLRLGLDWRARKFVQGRLETLAKSGRTGSKQGRAELLRETVRLLEEVRLAWLYTDVCNHQPMSQAQAQGTFQTFAVDARSRFQKEVVRALDGTVIEMDAGAQTAKSHEGPGTVVVTLIVAARRELLDVIRERDANEVMRLLAQLRGVGAGELVAIEVVWSPADENDRMSTAELEARYPEMSRFEERTIGGRVFCGYCAGPFADELAACPHCGAPHAGAS